MLQSIKLSDYYTMKGGDDCLKMKEQTRSVQN